MCVCIWGTDSCLQFLTGQIGQQMDPADTGQAVSPQGALLGQHRQLLQALVANSTQVAQAMADLPQQVALLEGSVPQSTGPLASTKDTSLQNPSFHVCDPEPYQGHLDKFFTFSYLAGLLWEKALTWAGA